MKTAEDRSDARELTRGHDEVTCPHCESRYGLILERADDFESPYVYVFRCEDCGRLSKQVWTLVSNEKMEG